MSQQKLDLIQLAARQMAQAGARAPEIVRCQLVDAALDAALFTTAQITLGVMPSPPTRPALLIARNTRPVHSDAFEELHARLVAEKAQGADLEDPDEYRGAAHHGICTQRHPE